MLICAQANGNSDSLKVMLMAGVKWQFRQMSRAEINLEAMEREFFQEEPINVRLVREVIQNSLDAAPGRSPLQPRGSSGPVRVRFSLAGINNPLTEELARPYFEGIEPHLRATRDLDSNIAERLKQGSLVRGGVPYMVVEDERTTGLNGDWEQVDDTAQHSAERNDFYWFFRNVGRSGKRASDNGSWGLGKWVFPDASRIGAYIAVTRRSGDDDVLLMGQAVLSQHDIDGRRYPPYGYYAEHGADGFQSPLAMSLAEQRTIIRRCIEDFDLRCRNAPGLSVIVPFPRVDSDQDEVAVDKYSLAEAVVHNYFYPIISGYLEVSVEGEGSPVSLNSSTIEDEVVRLDLGKDETGETSVPGYRKLFKMCRDIGNLRDDEFTELDLRDSIREDTQPHSDLVALRPRYEAGELLAFRIGTDVQRKNSSAEETNYAVYLQRDLDLGRGHDYYVRGTLSIPNMDFIGSYSARALLVVDEREPLAAMLRDSEPPSHNAWRPQVDRVAKQWVAARRRIDAVRYAPRNLLRILEGAPDGLQWDALADVFCWDGQWSQQTAPASVPNVVRESSSNSMVTPEPPTDLPRSRPTDFTITRVASGFRVRGIAGTEPFRARLLAAYVVPKGNPFNHYRELDFSLHGPNSLEVAITGGSIGPGGAGNELLIDAEDPAQFSLTVQGFDGIRDVRVDVKRLAPDSSDTEG